MHSCGRHCKNFVRNEDNLRCLKHMQNKLQLVYLPCILSAAASFFLWHFPHCGFIAEVVSHPGAHLTGLHQWNVEFMWAELSHILNTANLCLPLLPNGRPKSTSQPFRGLCAASSQAGMALGCFSVAPVTYLMLNPEPGWSCGRNSHGN